jgi:hypothetical protein
MASRQIRARKGTRQGAANALRRSMVKTSEVAYPCTKTALTAWTRPCHSKRVLGMGMVCMGTWRPQRVDTDLVIARMAWICNRSSPHAGTIVSVHIDTRTFAMVVVYSSVRGFVLLKNIRFCMISWVRVHLCTCTYGVCVHVYKGSVNHPARVFVRRCRIIYCIQTQMHIHRLTYTHITCCARIHNIHARCCEHMHAHASHRWTYQRGHMLLTHLPTCLYAQKCGIRNLSRFWMTGRSSRCCSRQGRIARYACACVCAYLFVYICVCMYVRMHSHGERASCESHALGGGCVGKFGYMHTSTYVYVCA